MTAHSHTPRSKGSLRSETTGAEGVPIKHVDLFNDPGCWHRSVASLSVATSLVAQNMAEAISSHALESFQRQTHRELRL